MTSATSARDLSARLADLLSRERNAMADFLLALSDFDRQRCWLDLGYASLFDFLHRELGLSKGAAHYRKTAAGLVQRFPEIVEPLRDGRLCISSVVELAKVLTPENRSEVVPRFFHASRREAMALAAEIRPAEAPPRREVVTAVRAEAPAEPTATKSQPVLPVEQPRANVAVSAPPPPAPVRRDCADPVTADLSRLHVTVSRRFLAKLEKARAALSHARPGATAEEILEAGLDLVLERDARRKALVEKPRNVKRPASPDRIPASVKREVWRRDGGRCQWAIESGGICGSTTRVELDHVVPRALGGPSTASNLRVLCKTHNDFAARRVFGDELMDRYTRKGGGAASAARCEAPAP